MHSLEGVGSGSSFPDRKEALGRRTAPPVAIDFSLLLRVTREFADGFLHRSDPNSLPHFIGSLVSCAEIHTVQSSTASPLTLANSLVFAVTSIRFLANA